MSSMTDDKLESNYKGNALLHLLSYMKPYAGWVMLCLVLVLALTGFDLYRPTLIGDAIDNFETQGDYNVIINTAWKYGIVLVVSFIFNMAQTWILQKTGQKIILTVRRELYIHIQSLSSRFFDLTPVGKLVTRVTNDVEALNEMYSVCQFTYIAPTSQVFLTSTSVTWSVEAAARTSSGSLTDAVIRLV